MSGYAMLTINWMEGNFGTSNHFYQQVLRNHSSGSKKLKINANNVSNAMSSDYFMLV